MKRKLSYCLFLWAWAFALPLAAHQVDWVTANQVTLSWQPVTTLEDGAVIPEGDVIIYETFYAPEIGNKNTDLIKVGETIETQYAITFDLEGWFFVGVRAVRLKAGKPVSFSKISWSDNPDIMKDGLTQGVIFFRQPLNPFSLVIK
ncbi:hypothetical protein ES702_05664 [subsurface metagenome]